MKKLKRGTMISKMATFLVCAAVVSMVSVQPVFALGEIEKATVRGAETYQYFFINGVQYNDARIYSLSDYTCVPAADIAKAKGDNVVEILGKLTIVHGDKTVVFLAGNPNYTVNGETKTLQVKDNNQTIIKSKDKKMYVPMEILNEEFGYNIQSDEGDVWVGETPKSLKQVFHYAVADSMKTSNMHLSMNNGWVCPQLKSSSVDDLLVDSKTLQRELEFIQNGQTPTSANYDSINGMAPFVTTSVGPASANEFTSILFQGYYVGAKTDEGYVDKINQINPQVLKFYFPNSWQWVHNLFMDSNNTVHNTRYTIDGRDVYFTVGGNTVNVHMSKVGGKLGEIYNEPLPDSSRTIGSSYTYENGYWEKWKDSWYYKRSDSSYAKGWVKDNGKTYYLGNDGVMKTGWILEDKDWYYFYSNGSMAINTTVDGYTVNENGYRAWAGLIL